MFNWTWQSSNSFWLIFTKRTLLLGGEASLFVFKLMQGDIYEKIVKYLSINYFDLEFFDVICKYVDHAEVLTLDSILNQEGADNM